MSKKFAPEHYDREARRLMHGWSPELKDGMLRVLVRDDRRERDLIHTLELEDHSWALLHPMACRPNLLDCSVQRYCDEHREELQAMYEREGAGRWPETYLHGATLAVGERE